MNSVWIVDDDESIRWVLERALTREGYEVRAFAAARECLDALDGDSPQVLVSDIRMPGTSGIELLQQFRLRQPATPVIIMTAYSDLDSAVSALQGGAFEYLPKPFDLAAALELVHRALDERSRETAADDATEAPLDMLGQAPAMQDVFRAIGRLSQSSATVLITGESGTGKELVARALHKHSPRAAESFVALNTAAIPRDLLESELFGHERGAFTGAQQLRRGRFEQARGGTLFLDEIGDMPPEMQTRLLRVLSDGQYYRVGGHQPLKAEARVIAATHQNLEERVRQGLFREDLFHRLNVIRLRLPPLRERREDIPVLVRHFLQRSARELGGEAKRLSAAALQTMTEYPWPGNVRQLENSCHWLTVMAPAIVVDVRDLPPEIRQEPPAGQAMPADGGRHSERGGEAAVDSARRGFDAGRDRDAPPATSALAAASEFADGAPQTRATGSGASMPGATPSRAPMAGASAPGASMSDAAAPASSAGPRATSAPSAADRPSTDPAGAGAFPASAGSTGIARSWPPRPSAADDGAPVCASAMPAHAGSAGSNERARGDTNAAGGCATHPWSGPALSAAAAGDAAGVAGFAGPFDSAGADASSASERAASGETRWDRLLAQEVSALLAAQPASASATGEVMDRLTREFEATVIATALRHTGGRRIEAAHRLGIGRNTITRKIHDLRLDDEPRDAADRDDRAHPGRDRR